MGRRRHTPEQIITALREAEVGLASGKTAAMVSRELGISEQTCGIAAATRLALQRPEYACVGGGERRGVPDVIPNLELLTEAREVGDEVAAVLERVHDVREGARVGKPECVAQLMDTGQIDNRVPEQWIQPHCVDFVRRYTMKTRISLLILLSGSLIAAASVSA